MPSSLLRRYRLATAENHLLPDAHQEKAAMALDDLSDALTRNRKKFFLFRKKISGLYLHGPVGRGKTMLMDWFLESLKNSGFRAERVHFHAFMLELHRRLHKEKRIEPIADEWVKKLDVLCFDEFHVTDVADAMVLMPLFSRFFARGLTIVTTSNWEPDQLYTGGLQRQRFLPFIDKLKKTLRIIDVTGTQDYRSLKRAASSAWLFPLTAETGEDFAALFRDAVGYDPIETHEIHVGNIKAHRRTWTIPRASKSVAWLDMSQLLEQNLGAADFLALAARYPMLFLDNLYPFSADTNEKAKRFIVLIDALYDKGVRLAVRSAVKAEKLYPYEGSLQFEFNRTLSRLREMTAVTVKAAAPAEA
jgi:cell division protein ZapE